MQNMSFPSNPVSIPVSVLDLPAFLELELCLMCERFCCWDPHMRHERDLSSVGGKCGAGGGQLEAAAAGPGDL